MSHRDWTEKNLSSSTASIVFCSQFISDILFSFSLYRHTNRFQPRSVNGVKYKRTKKKKKVFTYLFFFSFLCNCVYLVSIANIKRSDFGVRLTFLLKIALYGNNNIEEKKKWNRNWKYIRISSLVLREISCPNKMNRKKRWWCLLFHLLNKYLHKEISVYTIYIWIWNRKRKREWEGIFLPFIISFLNDDKISINELWKN